MERTQDHLPEPYLTTQEAATVLGVRRETVIRWLNSGHLKGFKLGGRKLWRISRQEIERFEKGER